MKFDQSAQWFIRKTCFNILMGIQYERTLDSVNFYRSNIELIYNHYLITYYMSSK